MVSVDDLVVVPKFKCIHNMNHSIEEENESYCFVSK